MGGRVVTGRLNNNLGRYGLDDNYHTNGYFNLTVLLADECELHEFGEPLTDEALSGCDILLIVNPDYQAYEPHPGPGFEAPEIGAIHEFVRRGGSVLLMVNSFLPADDSYVWKENYNLADVDRILEPFGIAGGNHISGNEETCEIAGDDPIFGSVGPVEYGHGGQVHLTPVAGVRHRVHFSRNGRAYCVSALAGRGTVVVLADAGFMSNGLVTVPWASNFAATRNLFRSLRPGWIDGQHTGFRSLDFRCVGYPHEGKPARDDFVALNPDAHWQSMYNYHYLTQERVARIGIGEAELPADPLAVASGRQRSIPMSLLGCELFKSPLAAEFPLTLIRSSHHSGLWQITAVGSAPLPQAPLADSCTTRLRAFESVVVEGGMQSLLWDFAVTDEGRLLNSRLKLFAEPAWKVVPGASQSLTLGRTWTLAPIAGRRESGD
jgi:hypothetical protein